LFKRRAEKYILKRIEGLQKERLLLTRYDIENEIKLFYIQGAFSMKTRDSLKVILMQKYDELYMQYIDKLEESWERDYQAKVHRNVNI
jgi:hypothetical protein